MATKAAPQSSSPPDNDEEVSSTTGSEDEDFGWVKYYLTLKGNEIFCEVEESYILDNFNLTGLVQQVNYFEPALDLITDQDNELNEEELTEEMQEMIENDAEVLYGLIHARYILTYAGLHAMLQKYRKHEFGICPRIYCNGQPLLPCGITDQKGKAACKFYCPKCEDLYRPKSHRHDTIDGAYFGTTFAALFFLTFPELKPTKSDQHYIPKVYGFKLHSTWLDRSIQAAKQAQIEYQQEQKRMLLERKKLENNSQLQQQQGGTPINIEDQDDIDDDDDPEMKDNEDIISQQQQQQQHINNINNSNNNNNTKKC